MSTLQIEQFPCLQDNYGFLLHDPDSGRTACIDTPDAAAILAVLQRRGWQLHDIWNTHHHRDHTGGNLELQQATGCRIVGPRAEAERIHGLQEAVGEGDEVTLGAHRFRVVDTPGHTSGHIVYWCPEQSLAFVGDTLFSLGCGRLFEGTAPQMWHSLSKLRSWPADTRIYCAHEYTQANARFALSVDPDNENLQRRAEEIDALRAAGRPTVPASLRDERAANPFLRADRPELAAALGMGGEPAEDVFARLRALKDNF